MQVFGVTLLSQSCVKSLRAVEGEGPVFLCPAVELLLITQNIPVHGAHNIPRTLPHVPLELLHHKPQGLLTTYCTSPKGTHHLIHHLIHITFLLLLK